MLKPMLLDDILHYMRSIVQIGECRKCLYCKRVQRYVMLYKGWEKGGYLPNKKFVRSLPTIPMQHLLIFLNYYLFILLLFQQE